MRYEVTITWADGTVEKVAVFYGGSYPRVRDGVLCIETGRDEQRCVPLSSIREYKVERL